MKTWKVVVLLLVAAFVVTPIAQAQDDDLRQEVEQLKRDLQKVIENNGRLSEDNAALRTRVDDIDVADDSLEARINALSESMNYAPATTVHSGANPVTIDGMFRIRNGYTFDRDFGRNSGGGDIDDDGSFVDARFQLGFTFELDRDVVTHISLQATGLFGNSNTPSGLQGDQDVNEGSPFSNSERSLDDITLYEAWVHINNIFGRSEFSARTGRQEIVLGNEFQFGNNDFFSGETHDGMHLMWQGENFNLHFIWAKMGINNAADFSTRNHPYVRSDDGYDDDEIYSLYFTLKSLENVEIDLYWIYFNGSDGSSVGTNNGLTAGADFFFHTIGARIGGNLDVAAGMDFNLEAAFQFGELKTGGADVDAEGLAIEAEIGLTLNADNKFRIFVRFLYAEGGNDSGTDAGYIPLFTERHANAGSGGTTDYRARYGLMDIIPLTNVLVFQGGLHFDPRADWTIGATFLYAILEEDFGSSLDDEIGFEIDLFADYRYSDQTTFSFGLGLFFADESAPLANSGGSVPNAGGFGAGVAGNDDDIAVLVYTQVLVLF